jgi:hypothetical protein
MRDQAIVSIATNSTAYANTNKYKLISVSVIAVFVVAVYATMFGNYRANHAIDTPWDLSFSTITV